MKRIHFILVVLIILLIILRMTRNRGYRYDNSDEGFEGGKEVVICKAEWCGHCKTAKPEFDDLLSASPISLKDGTKATVRVLDADADKAELAKYSPKGYPCIFIMNGGKQTEYPGPRTKAGVIDFLNSN
jgi:thiol-disulfide isomerase/thioredoxin